MDNKELYKGSRWNGDVGAVNIKYEEMTEEMKEKIKWASSEAGKKESKEKLDEILRKRGIK